MDAKALLVNQLASGQWLVGACVEGFSDSDCVAPLLDGGQTAIWILGHLATSEDWLVSKATGGKLEIAGELHEPFKAGQAPSTELGDYPPMSEVVALFNAQRERTVAAMQASDPATWDNDAPEGVPPVCKTIGGVWGLMANHTYWHIGQLTSIRRMLNKPSLMG
jgi:hypothetical protein